MRELEGKMDIFEICLGGLFRESVSISGGSQSNSFRTNHLINTCRKAPISIYANE